MKRKSSVVGIFLLLLLLLFLLRCPGEALAASRDGMKLWLNTLMPTLLPFLILTGCLIHTDGIERLFSPLQFLWGHVFGLSAGGAYAMVLGLLCGYPMGAKIASDLFRSDKICRREAEYLLTFCNNASPAFLTTYLAHVCLKDQLPFRDILSVLLASDLLCMLFFRFVVYRNRTWDTKAAVSPKKETSTISSPGTIIDISIMNGFETITRLGGYILLFSLLSAFIGHYWPFAPSLRCLLQGTLEITTGLCQISAAALPQNTKYLASLTMTAFGGICIMAQTRSILDKKLSLLPYLSAKLLNAACTASLCLILIQTV